MSGRLDPPRAARLCPVPTLLFETTVPAPIDVVWAFHQNVNRALPALSPPEADVRVESADVPLREGSRVTLTLNGPFGRRTRWVARYIAFVPPKAVVFGQEARWTDEQESGPFAAWTHHHEFESVDSKTTRIVDHVVYRSPLGPLGLLLDPLVIRPKLRKMFAHRHRVLRDAFAPAPAAAVVPTP